MAQRTVQPDWWRSIVLPYLAYLFAWLAADLLAYFWRFGWDDLPGFNGAPIPVIIPITQAVALAALFSWAGGRSLRVRDILGMVIVTGVLTSAVRYWVPINQPRSLLALQILLGAVFLLVTRLALSKVATAER